MPRFSRRWGNWSAGGDASFATNETDGSGPGPEASQPHTGTPAQNAQAQPQPAGPEQAPATSQDPKEGAATMVKSDDQTETPRKGGSDEPPADDGGTNFGSIIVVALGIALIGVAAKMMYDNQNPDTVYVARLAPAAVCEAVTPLLLERAPRQAEAPAVQACEAQRDGLNRWLITASVGDDAQSARQETLTAYRDLNTDRWELTEAAAL